MPAQTSYTDTTAAALEGQLFDLSMKVADTFVNAEASAELPFGRMCRQGTLDADALVLSATNQTLAGVLLHSHNYSKDADGDLGATGVKPKTPITLLQKGRFWAKPVDAVVKGGVVHVQCITNGGALAGMFRGTADGANTVNASAYARWLTSAAGGALAVLEIDMTNFKA